MSNKESENLDGLPKLGQWFAWVDRKGSVNILTALLILACVISVLWDFTYDKYGYFAEESFIGFYAIFGFVSFTGLIFAATGLRAWVMRSEDYYGDRAVDSEGDYPEEGLERKDHFDA